MDYLLEEPNPDRVWEDFMNFPSHDTDIFTTNYDDPNLFPPLDSLLGPSTPKANPEQVGLDEQFGPKPEDITSVADDNHACPHTSDGRCLECQVHSLASKVQELKSLYVNQEHRLWNQRLNISPGYKRTLGNRNSWADPLSTED